MTLYWPFFNVLVVICMMASLVSLVTGNRPMARVALVLVLNWAANTGFCLATGVYDPWYFYFIIDAMSAAVILIPPAGRVQAVIGYTFIGEILLHVVYGLAARPGAEHLYWAVLTEIGFVQLALLGAWAGGYGFRRLWSFLRPHLSRHTGRRGVA